ncbi:MAG: hypothetical protein H6700_05335 [Myxococcales bacterium]|nr:hypothetical protein [Myxococcales bacterium]MCB9531170.1 hypothetical protein [Myxococcales bacterium]
MRRVHRALFAANALSLAAAASGCQPKDLPVIPLSEVCATAEYGTTVSTAGFLVAPGSMMSCDGTTCEMALSDRGIGGNTNLRIDVRLGRGKNAMIEPPDRWSASDLAVKDNDGVTHPVGDWIIVQGRILNGGGACLITPVSFVLSGTPGGAPEGSGATAPPATVAPSAVPPPPNPPPAPVAAPPAAAPTGSAKPPAAAPAAPSKP